jgi:hypothetical protein
MVMTDCILVPSNTRGLKLAPAQQQQQRLVEACYTARGVLEECLPKGVNATGTAAAAASGEAHLFFLLLLRLAWEKLLCCTQESFNLCMP